MSELTPLTDEALNTLRGDFAQSGTNRLAMNAVTAAGIDKEVFFTFLHGITSIIAMNCLCISSS